MKFIYAILLSILVSCSCQDVPLAYKSIGRSHAIEWMDRFSSTSKFNHQFATAMTFAKWEKDFNRKSLPCLIRIVDMKTFVCGNVMRAWGCYHGNEIITVVCGRFRYRNGLPSLYHELCHRNHVSMHGIDSKHIDPRWETWDSIGRSYCSSIVRSFSRKR